MPKNVQGLLLLMLLGGCLLGSLLVWWQTAWRLRTGRTALPFRQCLRRPPSGPSVFLSLGLWMAAGIVAAGTMNAVPQEPLRELKQLCLANTFTLLLLPTVITSGGSIPASRFGIDLGDWKQHGIDGFRAFLASVLPVVLVLALSYPLRDEATQHKLLQLLRAHPDAVTVLWVALGAVLLAPLAEEMVYRVVLQGWLQSRIKPAWAITFVAVLFAALHPWPDSLPLIPLSLILGYVYFRRHSYMAVVVLHMLFNATNLALAVLSQETARLQSVTAW